MRASRRKAVLRLCAVLAVLFVLVAGRGIAQDAAPAVPSDAAAANPDAAASPDAAGSTEGTPAGDDLHCHPPMFQWYFRTEAVALRREVPETTSLAALLVPADPTQPISSSNWSGDVVLTSDDIHLPYGAGPRLVVGTRLSDTPFQVEFSYFTLASAGAGASASDVNGNLYSPFTNFGQELTTSSSTATVIDYSVDHNNRIAVHDTSCLDNEEANLRFNYPLPSMPVTVVFLAGVRHFGISEEFDYSSQPVTLSSTPTSLNPAAVTSHTHNDLWGGQLGGVIDIAVRPTLWVSLEGKWGLCQNSMTRDLDAQLDNGSTGTGTLTDYNHGRLAQNGSSCFGDYSVALSWRPTDGITARLGYQAIYINGLALASENFVADPASLKNTTADIPIDRQGSVIYHGPFAGLQLNW